MYRYKGKNDEHKEKRYSIVSVSLLITFVKEHCVLMTILLKISLTLDKSESSKLK